MLSLLRGQTVHGELFYLLLFHLTPQFDQFKRIHVLFITLTSFWLDSGGSRQADVFDQTRQFSIATRLTAKDSRAPHYIHGKHYPMKPSPRQLVGTSLVSKHDYSLSTISTLLLSEHDQHFIIQ